MTCPPSCVVSDHEQQPPVDWVPRTGGLSELSVSSTPAGFVSLEIEQWSEGRVLINLETSDAYLAGDEAAMLLDAVARLDEINGA
jgi:hypothetical protein